MKLTRESLAILLREADFLDDEQWSRYLRSFGGSKQLLDVLQQDVSLATFKDLLFAEIPLPFSRARREPIHEALSSQTIRLTANEILAILKAFRPELRSLTEPFVSAGLVRRTDVEAALRRHGLGEVDPYEQLIRQNVLTVEILTRFFGQAKWRRDWPYRYDLALGILEINNLIDSTTVEASTAPADSRERLSRVLGAGKSDAGALLSAVQDELSMPTEDVSGSSVDVGLVRLFPSNVLRRHRFVPMRRENGRLHVAFAEPLNLTLGDLLWLLTGLRIQPYSAPHSELESAIEAIFGAEAREEVSESAPAGALERAAPSASTVQLVSSIIEGAIELKATDVHLEPAAEDRIRVRYRLDGRLRNILTLPAEAVASVVSRIKVLANMNVTERRRPQDGHFDLKAGQTHYDFRISTLPCHLGEKVVIRILDESRVITGLAQLGVTEGQRQTLERLCRQPYGMILVTGPTGCGKSSTLYACLSLLNSLETNIVTIEDPVEYQLAGINQVQVNEDINLGFAQGLRAILRQDPDVIMVGEIRDAETAAIAIRAALTGHLVFSTLHTSTALGAYSTLAHMGIKPYLPASAILAIVAQRLVRMICPSCREAVTPNEELAAAVWGPGKALSQVMRGRGCDACMGTGYQGRRGVFEIVEATAALRKAAARGASELLLAKHAAKDGFVSLLEAGRRLIEAGQTTLEEVSFQVLTLLGAGAEGDAGERPEA